MADPGASPSAAVGASGGAASAPAQPYDSRRYISVNRHDRSHTERVRRLLSPGQGARVLEVGCGRGYLVKDMRERLGVEAQGVDVNPKLPELSVTPHVGVMSATALDYDDDTFDHLVAVHVIEHIPELDSAFREFRRVLKPGGTMLAVYPAEPIQGVYAIPTACILYRNPFKARSVHCHKLNRSKVRALGTSVGLTEEAAEFTLWTSPQFTTVFRKGRSGS